MLKSSDLFHLAFYKKSAYTGSMEGMRFLIEKASEDGQDVFKVWIFPGPLCFSKTNDDLKKSKTFAFSEDSIANIADWLNEQYAKRPEYWNRYKSLLSAPGR